MFGFCACWAAAGIFAVAATAQLTARTLQIFLNMPMMASSMSAVRVRAAAFAHARNGRLRGRCFRQSLWAVNDRPDASPTADDGADRRERFDEVLCGRYALSADLMEKLRGSPARPAFCRNRIA